MATYLVTGAAGFIAATVCEQLLAAGHRVVGVDNLNAAYDIRLKEWRLDRLRRRAGFTFLKADVADRHSLRDLLAVSAGEPPFEAVLHLAARAGVRPSVADPWTYLETNVVGVLNMLELCRVARVPKFILSSTSSLYGSHNALPFREEDDTDRPLSPYAASKKAAEALCHTYHHLYGIDISILRYFTVYGPAGRPDMSPFRFVQWISEGRPVIVFGDGGQSRDFTYVEDVARGTVAALKPLGYAIINLGSDRPIKLLDLIRLIEQLVGRAAQVVHRPPQRADMPATWADIGKARRLLDWQPTTRLEDGLAALVDWYRQNHAWVAQIQTE